MTNHSRLDRGGRRTRDRGHALACAMLMLLAQSAPCALADEVFCHHAIDLNCDQVVDGQDLSMVLGAWGTADRSRDFDRSCSVDGGDLAMILGGWGAVPEPPVLSAITFENEPIRLCTGSDSIVVIIDGDLTIDPDAFTPTGELSVTLQQGVSVEMAFEASTLIMTSGNSKIYINGTDPRYDPDIYFDGDFVPPASVMEVLHDDIVSHGMNAAPWSEESRMMMSLLLLHETTAVQQNIIAVQMAGENGGPGFWCKTAAIAAGSAITALATAGCVALTGACVAGTTVSFGGLSIPCTGLIGLCAGGVFAGAAAAYELALAAWGN